jgi:hypothetical protein
VGGDLVAVGMGDLGRDLCWRRAISNTLKIIGGWLRPEQMLHGGWAVGERDYVSEQVYEVT